MDNSLISNDIEFFETIYKNKYEVLAALIKKGYPDAEIVKALDKYSFKFTMNGNIVSIFMIVLAFLFLFFIKSTWGSFQYRFESPGDYMRLNEWVLKPFFILALLITGINLVINKMYIDKNVKTTMIVMFSIFIISSGYSNSWVSVLFGIGGITMFAYSNPTDLLKLPDKDAIITWIKNRTLSEKHILQRILYRNWKSSAIILFLLLAFVLFFNSPINVTMKVIEKTQTSSTSVADLKIIDYVLIFGLKILFYSTFIITILVNIDLYKFKYFLVGLTLFAFIFILISLFHVNFQVAAIPSLILFIAGLITIINKKLLLKKLIKPIDSE